MGYAVMGTASRTGPTRAVDAAIAAMASPLLEAGAIDGARGILINITGSSSLKLSEVNEASSIIQNAAHEDANIIFGAVQDERMGDEVKITVIATGFRQDPQPERRERMLAESTLPTRRYGETPVAPREPVVVRTAAGAVAPKFASEARREAEEPKQDRYELSPVDEAQVRKELDDLRARHAMGEHALTAAEEDEAAPEMSDSEREAATLIPVRASVFDDDFFRPSFVRGGAARGAAGGGTACACRGRL